MPKTILCPRCRKPSGIGTIAMGEPVPPVRLSPVVSNRTVRDRLESGWSREQAISQPLRSASGNPPCPHCGKPAYRHTSRHPTQQRWRCKRCRKTWYHGEK